jgi:hypothetical protein
LLGDKVPGFDTTLFVAAEIIAFITTAGEAAVAADK